MSISICVTIKNRSRFKTPSGETLELFQNFIKSLVEQRSNINAENVELIISDWGSNDYPLIEWVPQLVQDKFSLKIINIESQNNINRGAGRNIAANHSKYDLLFFADADMLFKDVGVVNNAIDIVNETTSYFPICWSMNNPKDPKTNARFNWFWSQSQEGPFGKDGWWRAEGHGLTAVHRNTFLQVSGFPEYQRYGGEDDDFFYKVEKINKIIRIKESGYIHQWHPQSW